MTARVFVVGSINVDLVMRVPRLPQAGETVLGGRFTQAHGGKGANQAVAAARLGSDVSLLGAVGSDPLGSEAIGALISSGVDVAGVVRVTEPTGVAVIIVSDDGENLITVASGANATVDSAGVACELATRLSPGDVVVANLEVDLDVVQAAADAARSRASTFILNPAPARELPRELLRVCDVLTPNDVEAEGLGFDGPAALLSTGVGALVITRGAGGADLYRAGLPPLHQDAFPVQVVDTTGAGDAFTATLAAALAAGETIETALSWATAAGSLATRALGARAGYAARNEIMTLVAGALRMR
jgi:ribokinase